MAAMESEEAGYTPLALQLGHVTIEVHAVDALDLQSDVVGEDFGDATW
jgi:hypothetical protein